MLGREGGFFSIGERGQGKRPVTLFGFAYLISGKSNGEKIKKKIISSFCTTGETKLPNFVTEQHFRNLQNFSKVMFTHKGFQLRILLK